MHLENKILSESLNYIIEEVHRVVKEKQVLEKALEIAVKDIVLNLHGPDACGSLDDAYCGVREFILNKAKEEVNNNG